LAFGGVTHINSLLLALVEPQSLSFRPSALIIKSVRRIELCPLDNADPLPPSRASIITIDEPMEVLLHQFNAFIW
jgi:hypothetical protein